MYEEEDIGRIRLQIRALYAQLDHLNRKLQRLLRRQQRIDEKAKKKRV